MLHPLLISNILKRRTSKGERKVSDRGGELETICKSCGLDSHGMIGESQVKDVFFSLKTLESKVVIKSFREDHFRLHLFNKST